MEREAKIQDKLKDLIEAVAGRYRFHGLEITRVERDYPIDARKVDLVLFMRGEIPFMFIETKRVGKERQGWKPKKHKVKIPTLEDFVAKINKGEL
jgi:hypothetical protein